MDIDQLIIELNRDEGLRLLPYRDTVGKLTIGVGRNLDDVGISIAEANNMLLNDINRVLPQLDKSMPWWRDLSEARQRVLCNMAFNLGITKLLKFTKTLKMMQDGKYKQAAEAMRQSLWYRQVGVRAERLAVMMDNG